MRKDILRRLNFLLFFLIALAAITIQSTIFGYYPLNYVQPDIFLILTVYMGFRRNIFEGAFFVILGSFMMESHSGVASSFFLASYLYSFLIAQILGKAVIVSDLASMIGIIASLTVAKRIGLLVLLQMNGHAGFWFRHFLIYLVPSLIVQIILTPILFHWFRSIDLRTHKDEHSEDEYSFSRES